eukprot:790237-Amphidinium_carterae.1
MVVKSQHSHGNLLLKDGSESHAVEEMLHGSSTVARHCWGELRNRIGPELTPYPLACTSE